MFTVLKQQTPTARKAHRCGSCDTLAVRPGQTYRRTTILYDGRVYDWVDCPDCLAINGLVWEWSGMPEEGIGPDSYHEWAHEHRNDETWGPQARAYLDRTGGTT